MRAGVGRPATSPETHFDAVVVGSGFGGSVMTYRLAEAGMNVCLLERGPRLVLTSREPLRVIEEVTDWEGHPPEVLQQMRDSVAKMREQGVKAINE